MNGLVISAIADGKLAEAGEELERTSGAMYKILAGAFDWCVELCDRWG